MTLEDALNWRYATKRMTGENVPEEKVDRILEAARLAPSSFGLQPYTLLVAEPLELRQRIAPVAMNQPQITECSHLVIFAAWSPVTEAQVEEMVALIAEERGQPRDKLAGLEKTVK
ncbi:MAG: nitroreductase family protein, partial [Alloalcanivorax venustensis]